MKSPQISLNRYTPLYFHSILLPWILLALVVQSSASTYPTLFEWGFGNDYLSAELPTCVPLQIVVSPLASSTNYTLGTPPYYMIAFVLDGTPVTTPIGTDPNNLSYTVTEPAGSRLALNVIDAEGRTGGIPSTTYTVIDGQSTHCVTTPPATPRFKITANVTKHLSTCQPWGITVAGGVPPYTLIIQAVNVGGTTNVTMPFGDDVFTYINRAPPNAQLLGAVSDLTGRWAQGVAKVNTIGSTDASCTGLGSTSRNSKATRKQEAAAGWSMQRLMGIIIPILSVVLIIGLIVAGFLYIRTRIKQADAELNEITPRPWVGKYGTVTSILSMENVNKYLTSTPSKEFSFQQDIEKITSPVQPDPPPTMPSLSPTSTNMTNVPNHSRDQALEKKIASPVQSDPSPSLSPTSTNITDRNVPNRTSDQARRDLENRSFSVSDHGTFDHTITNAPQSIYFLPTAGFTAFPRIPIQTKPHLNPGPEKRIQVINQDRGSLCVEAESFYNEHEPALSDAGSNVLPRSVSDAGAAGKRVFSRNPQQGFESESLARYSSEGSRDSSTTLTDQTTLAFLTT